MRTSVIQKKTAKTNNTDSADNDDAGSKDKGKPKALSGRRESKTKQKKITAETAAIDSDDWRDETYDDVGSDVKDQDPGSKEKFQCRFFESARPKICCPHNNMISG
jgi:hypothetical protein